MNNKTKVAVILLFTLLKLTVTSQSYTFFNHLTTVDIDYKTGEDLFALYNPISLENLNKIIFLDVEIKNSQNELRTIKRTYVSGRLCHQYIESREITDTDFVYNEFGYLVKGLNQLREYPEKNICLVYKNNKLEKKITLCEEEDFCSVVFEKQNKDGEFYIFTKYSYFYEKENLKKVVMENYNIKGIMTSLWINTYEYQNSNLAKKATKIKDEDRWEFSYLYDSNNNLKEIYQTNLLDTNQNRHVVFYDYDKYGNWTRAENSYENGTYSEIVIRKIQYQ